MEELSLVDVLCVFKRKQKHFWVVFGVLFLVSILLAFHWSNYRSTATVEIALPEISAAATSEGGAGAVVSAREAIADFRISYLQQKVLSTGSLVEIITKYNLYASDRERRPMAELADKMRKKINIDLLSASLANPAASQKATAGQLSAIAFDVSFDYSEPLLTQQVANEIVTRFLDEDIKQRRNQAKETTAFLDSQLKVVEASLAEQEKKIAEFRGTYGESRPEALAFNQQAAASIMMNIRNIESQITTSIGTQGALRAQLAAIDPHSRVMADGQVLTTPTIQLRALKSEYAMLTAKYGEEHPDVIKVSRQIEAMEGQQQGSTSGSGPIRALLKDAKTKRAALQKTYGAENPEIISLNAQIASYEAQLKTAGKKAVRESDSKDADNPAYLQVVAQLRASEEQTQALEAQKVALQAEMEKHQNAVVQNPAVEQQMAALSRDYENTQIRYRELKAKKLDAEMNETIEQDRIGQRLVMINPPELPLSTQPSRLLFLLGGFVFSAFAGVALVGGHILLNPTVMGARHLETLVGVAPLIVVPHLMTAGEKSRITKNQIRLIVIGLVGLIVAATIFSFVVMPLDVFVSVIALKLGLG